MVISLEGARRIPPCRRWIPANVRAKPARRLAILSTSRTLPPLCVSRRAVSSVEPRYQRYQVSSAFITRITQVSNTLMSYFDAREKRARCLGLCKVSGLFVIAKKTDNDRRHKRVAERVARVFFICFLSSCYLSPAHSSSPASCSCSIEKHPTLFEF